MNIVLEQKDGDSVYTLDGLLHNTEGPALVLKNGESHWYQHGIKHRTDGPASSYPDGSVRYYRRGFLTRSDGPALIGADGTEIWYEKDYPTRKDGPAITLGSAPPFPLPGFGFKATPVFYAGAARVDLGPNMALHVKGTQLHREDGPAVERQDGNNEYYLNNTRISEKRWNAVPVEFLLLGAI
jgi:hypothetical protein